MSRAIAILWISTSMLFTACVILACISPDWFNNEELLLRGNATSDAIVSFGLLRFCFMRDFHASLQLCNYYNSVGNIPSVMWILCAVVYGVGSSLMVFSLILSLVGCFCRYQTWNRLRIGMLYLQIFGVAFLMLSLIFFPIGLNSPFARIMCGLDADIYSPGQCTVSWGYMLAIMSVLLMLFLPVLAKYSSFGPSSGYQKTNCNTETLQLSPSGSKRMTTV